MTTDAKLPRLTVLVSKGVVLIVPEGDTEGRDPVARIILDGRTERDKLIVARAFAAVPELMEASLGAAIALRGVEYKEGISMVLRGIEAANAKARYGV